MTEWLQPDTSIVKHNCSIIHFQYIDGDGEIAEDVDIFYFRGISNTFSSKYNTIKYRDIISWFPLPELKQKNT